MKGHVSKDITIGKGHPLRGYISRPSFSIVIISLYLIIHLLFTVLYGLLCYIPSILDNSCVSELCSSQCVPLAETVSLDSSCVLLWWMCSTSNGCVSLDSSCGILRWLCITGQQLCTVIAMVVQHWRWLCTTRQ